MTLPRPHRALFFFIDGLGLGPDDPAVNPLANDALRYLGLTQAHTGVCPLPRGGWVKGIDACLGVPGLPQSATGQTALLTGANAPRLLGYHLQGFPNGELRTLLHERGILAVLRRAGRDAVFINAYTSPWFTTPSRRKRLLPMSVTSVAAKAAGQRYFDLDALRARRCLHQEFTNALLRSREYDVPLFTPAEAGEILGRESRRYDFCLYEYFQSDRAGHSRDPARCRAEARKLDAFLARLVETLDLGETLLVVTSDHGNLEDVRTRSHTLNPVPLLAWGPGAREFAEGVENIAGVTPGILKALGVR